MRRALLAVLAAVPWYSLAGTGASLAAVGRAGPSAVHLVHVDPVWEPTILQINEWVNDGINAAAAEMGLQDVPGVKRWVWGYPAGKPIGRGQSLRFIAVAAPQFVATVVGWSAAWDEETWARIQLNQDEVAAEVTRGIAYYWRRQRGKLLLAVGIEGRPEPDDGYQPTVALYYDNRWRCSQQANFSTLQGLTQVARPRRGRSALWATAYMLRNALQSSTFSDPSNMAVSLVELERMVSGPPNMKFDPRLPTPHIKMPGWVRVAIGEPDSLQYTDLRLDDK